MITAFIVLLSFCQLVVAHLGYSIQEQRRWSQRHSLCSGERQSPIAIRSEKTVTMQMPAIEMVGYHNLLPGPMKLHNNGQSVSLSLPPHVIRTTNTTAAYDTGGVGGGGANSLPRLPYIFGGLLRDEYELDGLHFHWGDRNNRGSEHVIDDVRYPLEMHIIHRNVRYASMSEALRHADGLCVLGFMFQISEHNSRELRNIMHNMDAVRDYDRKVYMTTTFALSALLGDLDTDKFYTYRGSLTTPPCSEAVTWVLFVDTLPVTRGQMSKFRRLSNGEDEMLSDNYRALQPTAGRRVYQRNVNTMRTDLDDVEQLPMATAVFSVADWYEQSSET